MRFQYYKFVFLMIMFVSGCSASSPGNVGQLQSYASPVKESDWIINGEPIQFEGEMWYPQDGVENFLDSEMQLIGEHKSIQFFVDKQDIRPFNRLYTKFGRNQFRYFEKK